MWEQIVKFQSKYEYSNQFIAGLRSEINLVRTTTNSFIQDMYEGLQEYVGEHGAYSFVGVPLAVDSWEDPNTGNLKIMFKVKIHPIVITRPIYIIQ